MSIWWVCAKPNSKGARDLIISSDQSFWTSWWQNDAIFVTSRCNILRKYVWVSIWELKKYGRLLLK